MNETTTVQGYCVKDKQMVDITNPTRSTFKNGRPIMNGTCPICGNKVFRILKTGE